LTACQAAWLAFSSCLQIMISLLCYEEVSDPGRERRGFMDGVMEGNGK
jgi:hypothetical protein